ncbi:MAG: hypothetical protein EHM93_18890 [Bacteroidales bacterium]|nr:MAG: hypothetical protein EHM93_18890 [Bacteroidales bacterium]
MKNSFLLILLMLSNLCFSQKAVLDKGFKNKESSNEMAVMIINQQSSTLNQPLTQNISDVLKNSKGYNTNPSFFNTDFIKKGAFEKIFNADKFKINKLHLKDNLDYICLGKYQVNGILKNEFDMFVADATLQLNIIDVKSGAVIDSRTYTDKGIGVTKKDAELNVLNKISELLK